MALKQGLDVIGINRSCISNNIFCAFSSQKSSGKFTFFQADINHDFDKIISILCKEEPSIIVDFAGQGMVAPSWDFPEQWYQTNLVSKAKIVNALIGHNWLNGYIRVSTPEVYGSISGLISENTAYCPSTPYAISHAAIDSHMMAYCLNKNFPLMLGRFANFYGEHQQLYRIIPRALYCAISNDKLRLEGGGHSIRAFIHAEDVAHGILSMADKGKKGEIYHFSTDEYLSIRHLVEKIAKITGVSWESFVSETADRLGKDAAYKLACEKAYEMLEWKPKITLQEGLERSLEWLQYNKEVINGLEKTYAHKP